MFSLKNVHFLRSLFCAFLVCICLTNGENTLVQRVFRELDIGVGLFV